MDIYCQGTCHPGERRPAEYVLTIPGDSTGGDPISWFGGPEPDIKLRLCGSCKDTYVAQNGGPEHVIVEAIALSVPEGPLFSPRRRETQLQ